MLRIWWSVTVLCCTKKHTLYIFAMIVSIPDRIRTADLTPVSTEWNTLHYYVINHVIKSFQLNNKAKLKQ